MRLMANVSLIESHTNSQAPRMKPETSLGRGRQPLRLQALRAVFSFPAALIALMAGVTFAFARNCVSDPDIWFHLHNADYFLSNLKVPHAVTYSYTVIGHLWINPEYLAEVPYYLAWRALGLAGIEAISLLLLEGIFFGLLYFCWLRSRNIKASVVATLLAVFLSTVSFGPRTILFGYAYLVLLLIILDRFRTSDSRSIWLLPPLFCLWINTHGSWSLGMLVFAIVIAAGLVRGTWGKIEADRWSPSQVRKLLLVFAASAGALFVNPYGYRLVLYPLDLAIRQNVAVSHVAEWVSVDFQNARGKVALILIVVLLLAALLTNHRWQLHELALALFGLYSGLTHIRFLFLAGILAAPLLAGLLRDVVPHYRREIDKPILNALIIGGVLLFFILGFPSKAQLRASVAKDFPADALSYLKSHPPAGRVLNSYDWGGYLCWNDRNFNEFIDSRADIFVYAGVFQDYVKLLGLKNYNEVLDKYGIRYVLFPAKQPLTYLLERDPGWKVIFKGKISVMFERTGKAPRIPHLGSAEGANSEAW